jgi:hypothetical protein
MSLFWSRRRWLSTMDAIAVISGMMCRRGEEGVAAGGWIRIGGEGNVHRWLRLRRWGVVGEGRGLRLSGPRRLRLVWREVVWVMDQSAFGWRPCKGMRRSWVHPEVVCSGFHEPSARSRRRKAVQPVQSGRVGSDKARTRKDGTPSWSCVRAMQGRRRWEESWSSSPGRKEESWMCKQCKHSARRAPMPIVPENPCSPLTSGRPCMPCIRQFSQKCHPSLTACPTGRCLYPRTTKLSYFHLRVLYQSWDAFMRVCLSSSPSFPVLGPEQSAPEHRGARV